MSYSILMHKNTRTALVLCLLALINFVLFYAIGVLLARVLGVSGYKAYSVAIATVTLLASFSTLGLEKYAQRALSAYAEVGDWSHDRGFRLFGRYVVLATALVTLSSYGLFLLGRWIVVQQAPSWTTLTGVLFLPAVVLALFVLELLTVSGQVVQGTFVYRVVLPLCVVLALASIKLSSYELTATNSVAIYGLAWVVCFLVLLWLARRSAHPEIRSAKPSIEPRTWLRKSLPFLIHSVMMTQFASLGIVGLELLGSEEQEVAVLAAAMQTGGFVILLATATNRLYGPLVSRLIEHRDYPGMLALIKERHSWVIPATLVYIVAIVVFGSRFLRLFGPEFEAGYPALCIIAVGSSISVWFSMAPNYLKFVDRNRQVLGITAAAGLLNVVLLVVFGPRWGATGAALAYSISLIVMASVFFALGLRTARQLTRD